MRELNEKLATFESRELNEQEQADYNATLRAFNAAKREVELDNLAREAARTAPAMSKNAQLREIVQAVRTREMSGDFRLTREDAPTNIVTAGVIQAGEKTNMESAGLPVTIQELVNPLEMGLIYDVLGLKVATGVRGQIVWPYLANAVEASVGGETAEVDSKALEFGKITAVPFKVGLSVEVSNEAINDAAFDLYGTVVSQLQRSTGRLLNKRATALVAPDAASAFVGPLVANKQTVDFAAAVPTYKELKSLKGKVLATGAEMVGFCYIMDAAMYSALEATPKDAGSGRFVIEGGKIDGDPIFLVSDTAYAGKVAAGCFGYEALNQHGDAHFIVDPYTKARKNVTVFTLNADFSLTYLVGAGAAPFAVGAKKAGA